MELIDEAHLGAAHARAPVVVELGAIAPVDEDVAGVRRLEQAGNVEKRRLSGPDGPTRAADWPA